MLILPEKIGTDALADIAESMPGMYDARALNITRQAIEVTGDQPLTPLGSRFLGAIATSFKNLGLLDGMYIGGGMFYRIIDRSAIDPATDKGDRFHYDADAVPEQIGGNPVPNRVIRVVTTLTDSGVTLANVFSDNPSHHGKISQEVMDDPTQAGHLLQPPNGELILFHERSDLHARAPIRPGAYGSIALFMSATFRTETDPVVDMIPVINGPSPFEPIE